MNIQKNLHFILTVFALLIFSSLSFAEGRKAEILYDNYGVPHIFSESDEDAIFAFGYVQAKDRMFMMDAMRRIATGRVSEILGSFALMIDRKYIVYDFEGTSKKQWDVMAPESRKILQVFADGVNYAVEKGAYSKFLYEKLNLKPEPFTPLDTLVIANFTAFMLEESVSRKMMMADLAAFVGKKEAEAVLGIKLPPSFEKLKLTQSPEDAEFEKSIFAGVDFPWVPKWGSNNWVIGKSKSGEGAAIMNNDPHVPFQQPCLFYEAHIKTPDSEIYGVTIPGVPAIAVGFTPHVSFGATVTWADLQDVVLMEWSTNKKQVYDGKKWVDVISEQRERKIKGDKVRKLTVQRTPYGPILKTKGNYAVVMRWSFDESPDDFVGAYKKLLTAKNVTEARAALRGFTNYSLNMVVADTEGSVGYQFTGKIPLRKGNFGFVPYLAGETDWAGFVPPEKLPGWDNPKEGYVYTANHNFFQKAGFPVSGYFDPGYRAKRIEKLLNEKKPLDKKAMEEMMSDDYSLLSEEFLPVMLKLLEKSAVPKDHHGIETLKAWDHHCHIDSIECSWFHLWLQALLEKTFKETLGSAYTDFLTARYSAVVRLLAYLKGEIKSEKLPKDKVKVAEEAFLDADKKLTEIVEKGNSAAWGKLHQIVFSNPFDLLGFGLSVGPYPVYGALFGVGRAEWDLNKPFTANFGAPFRIIAVMEKPVRAYTVLAPGQHEDPNSAHGKDRVDSWLKGELMPVLLDKEAVQKSGGEKIELAL